jgi:VanZ family protein
MPDIRMASQPGAGFHPADPDQPVTGKATPGAWLGRARLLARLGYLGILLLATLTPFVRDTAAESVAFRLSRALHPTLAGRDVVDGLRNVVLFAGWGAVWALTAATTIRRTVLEATFTGALVSTLVEAAQLFSSNRTASLVDVSTNTAGALAGSIGLLVVAALANERRGARSFVGMPALFFAVSYGLAAWLEAVIPLFRHDSLLPGGGPAVRLAAALRDFSPGSVLDLPWTDLPLFLPAGALAVAALAEHGVPYLAGRTRVMLGGLGLAVAAEILHGPVGQPISAGSALLHALAVGFGAWAAARWLPGLTQALRGANRPRALVIAYGLVLACWALRPFLPESELGSILAKLGGDWWIPLSALGGQQDFFSVVDVCAPFFLYLPLGGLLAVWPWRRHGRWSGPWPGIWLALGLECAQILVLGRMLDITDFMVTASGVLVGWTIFRRAGYRVYGEMFPKQQG